MLFDDQIDAAKKRMDSADEQLQAVENASRGLAFPIQEYSKRTANAARAGVTDQTYWYREFSLFQDLVAHDAQLIDQMEIALKQFIDAKTEYHGLVTLKTSGIKQPFEMRSSHVKSFEKEFQAEVLSEVGFSQIILPAGSYKIEIEVADDVSIRSRIIGNGYNVIATHSV